MVHFSFHSQLALIVSETKAYLIDLNSHHGTHVRKSGDLSSKSLKPETPLLLSNGDFVTFGKSVGKNEECVRPVVVRVELLYSGLAPPSLIKPLIVPSSPSISVRSASGRYGVHDVSSSDESSSSSNQQYSDIEEIPPPQNRGNPSTVSNIGRAFEVLRRLIPPSHPPCSQPPPLESSLPFAPSGYSSPSRQYSPEYYPTSPHYYSSPSFGSFASPRTPNFQSQLLFPLIDGLFDDAQCSEAPKTPSHSVDENKSRSNSPMDLASPSPAPPAISVSGPLILPPIIPVEEPEIMGAWPISPSLTPIPPLSPLPIADAFGPQNCAPTVNEHDAPPSRVEEAVEPEVTSEMQVHSRNVDELRSSLTNLEVFISILDSLCLTNNFPE